MKCTKRVSRKFISASLALGLMASVFAGCSTDIGISGDIRTGKTTIGVGASTKHPGDISIYIGHRMGHLADGYRSSNYFVNEKLENKDLIPIEPTRELPSDIQGVINSYYQLTPDDVKDINFYGYSVDLNGDDIAEQIVVLSGGIMSGTGGDSMVIIQDYSKYRVGQDDSVKSEEQEIDPIYRVKQAFTLMRLPIVITKLEPGQRYANIYVRASGGGAKSRDLCLEYKNGRYQSVNEASEIKDFSALKDKEAFILVE